jgi:hypothetical protein
MNAKNIRSLALGLLALLGLQSTGFSTSASEDESSSPFQRKIKRVYIVTSVPRPHCPVNGKHWPNATGIRFGGKVLYFPSSAEKMATVEFLTGQYDNPEIDVLKNLTLSQEDVQSIKIRKSDPITFFGDEVFHKYILDIHGKSSPNLLPDGTTTFSLDIPEKSLANLSFNATLILINELSLHFGLSAEKLWADANGSSDD